MKEELNTNIKKELPGALRDAIRKHPLKKLLQEEEARIRLKSAEKVSPAPPAPSEIQARVVPIWRRIAAVAAVILVLGFSGFYTWQTYFAPPPLAISLMIPAKAVVHAGGSIAEENFRNGREAYAEKQYKKAISHLKQIPSTANFYHEAQLLLANAYHLTGEFNKAIPIYRLFLDNNSALLIKVSGENQREDNLRWNLVLAYFGSKQLEQARSELNKLKQLPQISKQIKSNMAILEKQL